MLEEAEAKQKEIVDVDEDGAIVQELEGTKKICIRWFRKDCSPIVFHLQFLICFKLFLQKKKYSFWRPKIRI